MISLNEISDIKNSILWYHKIVWILWYQKIVWILWYHLIYILISLNRFCDIIKQGIYSKTAPHIRVVSRCSKTQKLLTPVSVVLIVDIVDDGILFTLETKKYNGEACVDADDKCVTGTCASGTCSCGAGATYNTNLQNCLTDGKKLLGETCSTTSDCYGTVCELTNFVINIVFLSIVSLRVVYQGRTRRRPGSTGFNMFLSVRSWMGRFSRESTLHFCRPFQLGATLKGKEFAPRGANSFL